MNSYKRFRFNEIAMKMWMISNELDEIKKNLDKNLSEFRSELSSDKKEAPAPPPDASTDISWISVLERTEDE